MSSTISESRRAREASRNGIVRRMVSLPRNLLGGLSRAMGHGVDIMGLGGRRSHSLPSNFPLSYPQEPFLHPQVLSFLDVFEQKFGPQHPFFYPVNFMEALKLAENENKFLFMYLHSSEHPFTPSFCRDTLCSDLVVQYLAANFVSWGGFADREEGLQMAATLRPASFPFCAVIAPAPGDNMAVLRQVEGPVSPAELVEILQRTVEEQGLAFGNLRAKQAEKIRADRQLREEQDAAYFAALQMDQEKEKLKTLSSKERVVQKPVEAPSKANYEKLRNMNNSSKKQYDKVKEASTMRETQFKEVSNKGNPQATQILIRFPNGERREQSFACTDKVQSIYRFIDSLGLPSIGNYRLISSFPRKTYGVDQMGQTLKDAGLHPRASLFLEPL